MITVVGAGMSGLLSAHLLNQRKIPVRVIERSKIAGGLLSSELTPYGPVEYAATSLLSSPILRELARLTGTELIETSPLAKKRYFCFKNSVPERWPLSLRGSLRMLTSFTRTVIPRGRTFQQYAELKFGRNFAATVGRLLTLGIYATTADQLSASLVLENFRNSRLLKKTGEKICLPKGGFATWTNKIAHYLRDQGVLFEQRTFEANELLTNEKIILAVSLDEAQSLIRGLQDHPNFAPFAADFLALRSISLTSTTLFFKKSTAQKFSGFGILFDDSRILGVIQNDQVFPDLYPDFFSETWILRESVDVDQILRFRAEKVGRENTPLAKFLRPGRPAKLPLYDHRLERFLTARHASANVQLVGNYLGRLGLSGLSQQVESQLKLFLETGVGLV